VRKAFGYAVAAVIVFAAAVGSWTIGRLEQRLADARMQLLTLKYDVSPAEYDAVERVVGSFALLPWFAARADDVRDHRAESTYWRRDYRSLALAGETRSTNTHRTQAHLLVAANATFRRTQLDPTDPSTVERLNNVLGQYAEILKRDPEEFDAAYNYEFVAQTRDAIAATQRSAARRDQKMPPPSPPDHTLHGQPGGPPDATGMREFKIIVPQRSDERRQAPDAGMGGPKSRKG